jgi:acyl dehydratase
MDFDVPVERGHVLQFARAIGAPESPPDAIPSVPPTFVVVADHFDPRFDRRPSIGQPWIGSGRTASGVADDDAAHDSLFHVEQRFTYTRALQVGEVLRVHRVPPRTWTTQGRRAGRLQFVELVTELRDRHGTLVATNTWVDVATERTHAEVTVAQPTDRADTTDRADATDDDAFVVAEQITRTQIVMYAGASGDFHPLHHDDVYARHRGYPGSFVPGMLTMAIAGRAVATVLATDRLAEFGGRFHAQVWPGDTLLATVQVTDTGVAGEPTAVTVALRTHRGMVVFTGDARTHSPDVQAGNSRSSSASSVPSSTG